MFENKKLLSSLVLIAAASLSIFFLTKSYEAIHGGKTDKQQTTITVSGEGEYFAIPDTAAFTFSVEKEGATQKIAQDAGTEIMNKILASLKKDYGMTDKDLKTINFSVNPKYEYGPACYGGYCPPSNPKINGYTFTQTVTAKVRNLDKVSEIGAKLAELSATNVSGPDFTLADEDDAKNKARTDAITEAKVKARILSNQLGVKLGKISSFSENTNGAYPMYSGGDMMVSSFATKAAAPQIPTGENKYTSSVNITYEIK